MDDTVLKDFRACIATDDVERIPSLIQAVQIDYSEGFVTWEQINTGHRTLINFVHEAVEARATSIVNLLLSQKYVSTWSTSSREFFWVTTFERVCENADDAAALFMLDSFPFDGWETMLVADRINLFRQWIYPDDAHRDFYTPLLYLHAKIPDAKKALERTRFRGLFRRWALNEELLAPAYVPPTAEAAGGTAFQRAAEVAALVVLA